jgi:osmotically-inducible protein OsmY
MANIHIEVANALHFALAIPPHKVMAEVTGGVVTLRGVVDRAYQKSFAEAIARRVPGVVDVRNDIAIGSPVEFSLPSLQN